MAVNSLGGEVVGPLGLLGDVPVPSIETRSEEQLFSDITTPTGLKPVQPGAAIPAPADEWAEFQDAGFEAFQDAPDQFADFQTADDLDVKSIEELDKDRAGFDPVTYLASNPDVAKDLKKFPKLLDIARRRYEEGLTAKGVAEAAFSKGTKKTLGELVTTAPVELFEHGINVVVQPTANVILGTISGDLFNKQRRDALFNETRKIVKKGTAEGASAVESTTVGLADLSRQGVRKLEGAAQAPVVGSEFETPAIPKKKPLTDNEVLQRLSEDAAFRKNAEEILTGQGEAARAVGLDKETLAKQGIELDPEAIRLISLVEPVSMIATGGAFKLVGLGGKVLATARTLEGVKAVTDGLTKVASVSRTSKIVGGTIEKVGKVAADARRLQGRGFTAASLLAGGFDAALGARLGTAAIDALILPTVKKVGKTVEQAGKIVAGKPLLDVGRAAAESSAGAQRLADIVSGGVKAVEAAGAGAKVLGKGAFTGVVAGSPFAIAAETDEQAGTLLGVGAALGAGGAAGAKTFRVVRDSTSRRYFGENRPVLPDVASPAYGFDAALDTQHEANVKKLSAQDASELNNFREALRQQGGEFYAMDRPSWRAKLEQRFPDATPEQLDIYENHSAFFDESQGDRKIVYLNTDTTGLRHDAGHIFDAILAPEKRTELRKAVTDTFGQKSIDDFKATYERRVGSKISDVAALDEYIAEQFAALFNNVPVTELNAPKSLLNKFIDVAAEGAEAFGIDLSAGATTPNIGAPVSVGIRKLFQQAAGEVTRRNVEARPEGATPPIPAPLPTPEPPVPTVEPVVPLAPAPATRNIRVTPEQTAPLETSQTRAAAAERSKVTGISEARELAKKSTNPAVAKAVEDISTSMETGNPVVKINHLGITSPGGPGAPEGAVGRKATREAGYAKLDAAQIEFRENAPADIVSLHEKTFKPLRWDGTTLIAVSIDKIAANAVRIAKDPKTAGTHPYPVKDGKFTEAGWKEVLADAQIQAENQAAGRKGNGERLELPAEELGLSIPAEDPNYTPKFLSDARANFQNAIQGVETPRTARETKGQVSGNIKGQLVAEANKRAPEIPANIPVKAAGKQAFASFPGRVVREVNPFRNELERRGFNTRNLDSAIERIRAQDIVKSEPRPGIKFSGMVTDISRAGFSPAPTEFRQKNLGGRTVEEFSKYLLESSSAEWIEAVGNMVGGQTGGSINLGLGLRDRGDLAVLQKYREAASTQSVALMDKIKAMGVANATESMFTEMQAMGTKAMFFRESLEAATGTGSMGAVFKVGRMGTSGVKPPFPIEAPATESTSGTTTESSKTP